MKSDLRELMARLNQELAPRFEVVKPLGEGKNARVFLAREAELRRMVAIKVLRAELARDEVAPLRFAREAQSAGRIAHPNVTAIYQVGRLSDETPYLIMEHVEGGSIAERVEAVGPFQPLDARSVIHDVASALAAAHRRGIVHRDVRPSNVLWKAETGQALLTDFGLAAVEPSPDHTTRHLTRSGEVVMGDVTFTSPEQLTGDDVSGASDIYSLGGLAHFLMTGRGPFEGRSAVEVASKHLKAEPPDFSHIPGLQGGLAALFARCMAKNPAHRPTADDVARATSQNAPPLAVADGSESLWNALKKRRFAQLLGAYIVGGWVVIQVVDALGQNGVLPEVAFRVTLTLFLVGFSAVGVVGWFHGERGRQEFRKLEAALLGFIVLVAIAVSWLVVS
ncbi:MAG: serine/threonine protein kinase [Gemmatimonadetes bacterium]|nr:serine/threonine protein kinase [Gemmatimonadota bacterium]